MPLQVTFKMCVLIKNDEAKLKSVLFGGTAQVKTQKAFNLCEDFFKGELTGNFN